MSDQATLAAIKSQVLALMAAITENPKPSYSIDGQSVSWSDYLSQLRESVEWCDRQLARAEPFEIHSQGFTS